MTFILALDTSSEYCSVALRSADGGSTAIVSRSRHAGQTHSELLLGMVADVLAEAGLDLARCDAIAFGAGPGSFTGLRIACAVAQGLAFGVDRPVVAIGTLSAMAEQARRLAGEAWPDPCTVLVAQDARMGEVYWAQLQWLHGHWIERIGPGLSTAAMLRADGMALHSDRGCGNGYAVFAELTGLVDRIDAPRFSDAIDVAGLAADALARGESVPADRAAPLYVRDRIALTSAERELAKKVAA